MICMKHHARAFTVKSALKTFGFEVIQLIPSKYRNLLCSCDVNGLQISWWWTLFELITAISEMIYEFLCMKHIIFMGNANCKNLHIVKTHADEWKLSYFESSITSKIHSPTNYHVFDTCLIFKLPKMGRKIVIVALSPYFSM